MADQVPSIIILKSDGLTVAGVEENVCRGIEENVCRGIEEEGIPFEVKTDPEPSAAKLAYKAALTSRLNVGVGIGADRAIAVQYSQLEEESPLFTGSADSAAGFDFTVLGINAARLVKGLPFKKISKI